MSDSPRRARKAPVRRSSARAEHDTTTAPAADSEATLAATHQTSNAGSPRAGVQPLARVARHVQPVGPRVLVRVIKSPDRTDAGLFLPQGVRDDQSAALLGHVLEVARAHSANDPAFRVRDDREHDDGGADLGVNVSGIPLDAYVLFPRDRGVAVPWDETLRLLDVRHVLAIVDEIPEEHLQ